MKRRIAVLMTCHNRREKTLACLQGLSHQNLPPEVGIQVYLVDDGSTDGTAAAVKADFPQVKLIPGDGNLYWSGGMRLAFGMAMKEGYDYYLWLNDDTNLFPHALENLLATEVKLRSVGFSLCIVIGSVCDPENGKLTYGGCKRREWRLLPLHFSRVEPGTEPTRCETFEGNCVLIPHDVAAKRVGNIDPAFMHQLGDTDYGLRALRDGVTNWIAPGFVGTCSSNQVADTWMDWNLPLRVRLKKMAYTKGMDPGPWKAFVRRHGGPLWPLEWLWPYINLFLTHYLRRELSAFNPNNRFPGRQDHLGRWFSPDARDR
jgi:GT2 family glycosyltransferase